MRTPIALRGDYNGFDLRRLARASKDADQTRRLLALAIIYDGETRTRAAEVGGVTLQIIRDWVLRFNRLGPDGLRTQPSSGRPSLLNDDQRKALADIVEQGPRPAIHNVVRWRLCDLVQWIWEEFGVSIGKSALSNELRAMGYRKLSARPRHHSQDPAAIETFKKTSPPAWRKSPANRPKGRQ